MNVCNDFIVLEIITLLYKLTFIYLHIVRFCGKVINFYTPIDILRSCSLRGRTWFLQECGKPKCRSSGIGDTGMEHYVLEIHIFNSFTYKDIGTNFYNILHIFHSTVDKSYTKMFNGITFTCNAICL